MTQLDMGNSPKTEALNIAEEQLVDEYEIVLYDDDFHTFDFVIESLMEICDHDSLQAEQCTMIVHYKGKCAVKKGSYEELKPRCSALLDRGLSAEIE